MNWHPIHEYKEKLHKSHFVVFLVAESKNGRSVLPQTISKDRHFGFRTITHFCVLPDVPEDSK